MTFISTGSIASEYTAPYYARLDIKSFNRVIVETKFLMEPFSEEFRIEKFELKKIKGESDYNQKIDMVSAARHNAVARMLSDHGLKSIKSRSSLLNGISLDEITVTYEGFLKYPFKMINKGYDGNNRKCIIEMEIWFAPLATPDRWSFLYMKNKVLKFFSKTTSLF